jgi:death on curing protein
LNHANYGEPDVAEPAARHAMAIVQNHPFVDGNKRTAYVMLETFLELNGVQFTVGDMPAVIAMLSLASGNTSDDEFIARMRANASERRR